MTEILKTSVLIIILSLNYIKCQTETNWKTKYPTCDSRIQYYIVDNKNNEVLYDQCGLNSVYLTQQTTFIYRSSYFQPYQIHDLNIINSTMNYIPNKIFKALTNLKIIECVNCKIMEINLNTFDGAFKLRFINFDQNNIKMLGANYLKDAKNLEKLILSNNDIETIDVNAFNQLTQLIELNLSNNKIKTLESGFFRSLNALENVYLKNNLIETLNDNNLFETNIKLKVILMQDNKIVKIDNNVFNNLHNLESLDVASNRLTEFQFSISNNAILKNLNVSHNFIAELNLTSAAIIDASYNNISEIYFTNPEKIVRLNLEQNDLKNINFLFGNEMDNSSLEFVDLSHNPIGQFNASNFKKLTGLYLENSNLSKISYEMFGFESQLETLDISYNYLGNIDFSHFHALQVLENLYIEGNFLTQIEEIDDLKLILPKLNNIGLTDNNFKCQDLRQIYRKLTAFGIKMYVDASRNSAQQLHFRGIKCSMNSNLTNFNDQPLVLPQHYFKRNLENNKNIHDAISEMFPNFKNITIDQINVESNETNPIILSSKVVIDGEEVKIDAKSTKTLDEIAVLKINDTTNMEPLVDPINDDTMKTNLEKIQNSTKEQSILLQTLLTKLNASSNNYSHDTTINDKFENISSLINNLNTNFIQFNQSLMKTEQQYFASASKNGQPNPSVMQENGDLTSIKVMVSIIFIAGVIFVALKFTKFIQEKKSNSPRGLLLRTNSNATSITALERM